jgi:hypothetical protein
MYEQPVIELLQEKHPGAFEEWDGFEVGVQLRNRQGDQPLILVTLYNKGTEGFVVDLHACFLVTEDDGKEVIRVGRHELAQEYNEAYIPEFAK